MAAIQSTPALHPIHIPEDILRLILEELFNLPGTSYSRKHDLIVLSSHVRAWLQPLLYRHLDMSDWPADVSTIFEEAPRQGMFTHTRSIFIREVEHIAWIPSILKACSKIEQLACWFWGSLQEWQETLEMTHQTLRRLSISYHSLENTFEINQPLFRSLTHLDLSLGYQGTELDSDTPFLQGFRSLSDLLYVGIHVLVNFRGRPAKPVAQAIAPELPPALRVALLWHDDDDIDIDLCWLVEECDPRIAFYVNFTQSKISTVSAELMDLLLQKKGDEEEDWNPGSHPDVWERAEEILEKRRALKMK